MEPTFETTFLKGTATVNIEYCWSCKAAPLQAINVPFKFNLIRGPKATIFKSNIWLALSRHRQKRQQHFS